MEVLSLLAMLAGIGLAMAIVLVVGLWGRRHGWHPVKSVYVGALATVPLLAASYWLVARVWWAIPLALLVALAGAGYFSMLYRFSVSEDGERLRESARGIARAGQEPDR